MLKNKRKYADVLNSSIQLILSGGHKDPLNLQLDPKNHGRSNAECLEEKITLDVHMHTHKYMYIRE